ncbi:hypothetical protein GALMADRAFT_77258 [Galerina marginata CBS 339.88]|uniref:NAD-dependent epimerase/dehydratase domain-containing protein n=1 Tax=Galerina marginata (strain CBS 339.88) TaxID=685588 RepID=A0A067SPF6_GALM3|nr:hypothetical protein GALMADRAFT_77258 [Galerina marginata CBS 339.88]
MPVVEPNESRRVLVTGANGYIAMWIIQSLLEHGYLVRGTVRSEEKGKGLTKFFSSYGSLFEWVIIEDITKNGAFDEAVREVDAIEHVASPLGSLTGELDDYIQPAVNGTRGILESAREYGTSVKRIVITSSGGAIVGKVTKPGSVFDETNWGDYAVQIANSQGKNAAVAMKYSASKTLAERAAWDFYTQCKSEVGWDLVSLNPSLVLGPTLQDISTPADLSSSLAIWWDHIKNEKADKFLKHSFPFVDVRDTAAAHVAALQETEAGGERIIISSGMEVVRLLCDTLSISHPELYTAGILPRGNPKVDYGPVLYDFNSDKGKRILGIKYRPIEVLMDDTLEDFKTRGWLA